MIGLLVMLISQGFLAKLLDKGARPVYSIVFDGKDVHGCQLRGTQIRHNGQGAVRVLAAYVVEIAAIGLTSMQFTRGRPHPVGLKPLHVFPALLTSG